MQTYKKGLNIPTYTKGNIRVENIKVGDIHYEFAGSYKIVSTVQTLPVRNSDGLWSWTSIHRLSGKTINYSTHEKYGHYGPNLYDYEAYANCKEI